MDVQDNQNKQGELRQIMETINAPEALIQEIEAKPPDSQAMFVRTIREIMKNEILNLLAFLEARENIQKRYRNNFEQ